jgi:hypothetical protein
MGNESWLRLVLQPPMWGNTRLWVRVDDVPVPTETGENLVPVTPGRHSIEITDARHPSWRSEFEVGDGDTVSLYFAPPFRRGDTGSLEAMPQPFRGPGFLAVVAALIVLGLVVQFFLR